MLRIALKMLAGDRVKYAGLLFGVALTSFLVTFAASYFAGFMTRGFALISENPNTQIWVMNSAVTSVEPTTTLPDAALERVRSVEGVSTAAPLLLATTDVIFPNGRFQSFQVIGVDGATLAGLPALEGENSPAVLRNPDAAIVARGGTSGKLQTPVEKDDQWVAGPARLEVPTRRLAAADEVLINDHRVVVAGGADALPRYPPRPLLYMTISNALRVLPVERHRLTFILVRAAPGVTPGALAARIEARTGFRARTSEDFKADTVRWTLANSEDVGDIQTILSIAGLVGFGMTGVLLYMFTAENLRHYAVLKTLGATRRLVLAMVFAQTAACAILGTGLGLGACALAGQFLVNSDYPFRMMWFNPLLGIAAVFLVSIVAAFISARPALKLDPAVVFSGR